MAYSQRNTRNTTDRSVSDTEENLQTRAAFACLPLGYSVFIRAVSSYRALWIIAPLLRLLGHRWEKAEFELDSESCSELGDSSQAKLEVDWRWIY